jgi:hypothetical protein
VPAWLQKRDAGCSPPAPAPWPTQSRLIGALAAQLHAAAAALSTRRLLVRVPARLLRRCGTLLAPAAASIVLLKPADGTAAGAAPQEASARHGSA